MKCAICSCKSTEADRAFRFPQLLRELGFVGQLAHPHCVKAEQKACVDYKRKYGVERDGPCLQRP